MQDIADTCRVGKGTLYQYFSSKENLFIELCLAGHDVDPSAVDAAFLASDDPGATLGELLDAMLGEVPTFLERMPLYFTLWARLSYDERYRDQCHHGFRELYREFREALARGLVRGQERGVVRRDVDPGHVATLLMCALDGYTYARVFASTDIDPEAFEPVFKRLLLSALAPPREGGDP